MTQESLSRWEKNQESFANAEAEVLLTLNFMAQKYPLEFNHGMTKREVTEKHGLLVKEGRFKKRLAVYDNKMRSLFKKGLAGRHTVHGERHYFALALHEEGLVDHSRCMDCEVERKHNMKPISLKDFEVRYTNIRIQYPKVKKCSVSGCNNPIDHTPKLGWDTCCAYHRLLFDFWSGEIVDHEKYCHYLTSQKGRRRAFTNWMNKTGKQKLDGLVLEMAQQPINWEC